MAEKQKRTRKQKVYASYKDIFFRKDSWSELSEKQKGDAINKQMIKHSLDKITGKELDDAIAFHNQKIGVTVKTVSVDDIIASINSIDTLLELQSKLPAAIKAKSVDALAKIAEEKKALDDKEKSIKSLAK